MSRLQGSRVFFILDPLNMGPIGYPETSARNYHCSLCNNAEKTRRKPEVMNFLGFPEEGSSKLFRKVGTFVQMCTV